MPSKTFDDYISKIEDRLALVDGLHNIGQPHIASALEDAVSFYSNDKPYTNVTTITGDNSSTRFDLPSDWTTGFSEIIYAELNAEQEPVLLEPQEIFVWDDGNGDKFQLSDRTLSASDTVKIKYTREHTLDSTTNTIPDVDFVPVTILGTSFTALIVAGILLKNRVPQGNAGGGISDFRTLADEYRNYSKELMKLYFRRLGISESSSVKARLEVFDLDPISPTGLNWLTHPNR